VDAYGEVLGNPVLKGASLQGEVVSRTYPHHSPERWRVDVFGIDTARVLLPL
jgi:hypothetical protein